MKPLEPSSRAACLLGSERLDAFAREIIDDAGGKRRFRADHDEVDLIAPAERDHGCMIGDVEADAFGFTGDTGIAGRAPEFCHQRGRRNLPRKGVFAAAGTKQKDFHFNVGRTKLRGDRKR